MARINDYSDLETLHVAAASQYGSWAAEAARIESIWKGTYGKDSPVEGGGISIVRPSQGRNIMSKLERMLAVRSTLRVSCIPANDTKQEIERAEKRERALRAYLWQHRDARQSDVFRDGTFFNLHRGRGDWLVQYKPDADNMKVRITTPDPLEVYPMWTDDGILYHTSERLLNRYELEAYLEGLSISQREKMEVPDLRRFDPDSNEDISSQFDMFRILEYWDEYCYAWAIETSLVQVVEHNYGFHPLTEARFNHTPLRDQRWASQGVLWPVADDLMQIAKLMAKAASAVELFYYPMLFYKSTTGEFVTHDTRNEGGWESADEDFQPMILNPEPNDEMLNRLMTMFNDNIAQGTITPKVFNTELQNVSGFAVNQILSTVKDDLIDYQDALEWAFSRVCSTVLRIWDKFANEQPDKGWWLPMAGEDTGRKRMELLTADDIDGNYKVEVKIKVDLPQDLVAKATIFNQLYQIDETGRPRMDRQTAFEMSGLIDDVPDWAAAERRREFEYLINTDEQARTMELAELRAKFADVFSEYEKDVERAQRKRQQKEDRRTERDIERGLSDDVVLPGELFDPQHLTQLAMMAERGIMGQDAIRMLEEGSLALGVPGADVQGNEPQGPDDDLLTALFGPDVQVGQQGPDGFTGYGGIDNRASPPAMRGAQPRQSMDRARLEQEDTEDTMQRGALPPRR